MAYQRRILSDATPTTLNSFASVLNTGSYSASIDCWNYHDVEFFIKINSFGSATTLQVNVGSATTDSLTPSDWALYTTEDITSGAAPQSTYTIEYDLTSLSAPCTVAISVPVRGRFLRIFLLPDATISTVTVSGMRRV